MSESASITIVSNRLPVTPTQGEDGGWTLAASAGGLVNALDPILRQRGGRWLGWSGLKGKIPAELPEQYAELSRERGYQLQAIPLSGSAIEGYYNGFSNRAIWPLFHNMPDHCAFDADDWHCYQQINRKFAQALQEDRREDEQIWVHDYHLMLAARELRAEGEDRTLGFFLHIPFPPPDTFMMLPWREEVLQALLQYDLLGFQTIRDRDNFLQCVNLVLGSNQYHSDKVLKRLRYGRKGSSVLALGDESAEREALVGCFPISVDFDSIESLARSEEVQQRAALLSPEGDDKKLIFGADRLDYTKGLLERMKAYQHCLRSYPELHGKVTFVQYVVPGRESIPEYEEMHHEIERLVGEILGEFTRPGWVPLHYVYRKLSMPDLVSYYLAADVALVTPIRDGMNLVAKEYCAARHDEAGVLVLSEFAGAVGELRDGALVVNPYDLDAMAACLYQACNMTLDEQRSRMQQLRRTIVNWDIYDWVDNFLDSLMRIEGVAEPAA